MQNLTIILLSAVLVFLALIPPAQADENEGIWINPALGISTPEEAAWRLAQPFHQWLYRHLPEDAYVPVKDAFFVFEHWREDIYSDKLTDCVDVLEAHGEQYIPDYRGEELGSLLDWGLGWETIEFCLAYQNLALLEPIDVEDTQTPDFLADKMTLLRLAPPVFLIGQKKPCSAVAFELMDRPELAVRTYPVRVPYFVRRTTFVLGTPWHEDLPAEWALWSEGEPQTLKGITFVPKVFFENAKDLYVIEIWGVGQRRAIPGNALVALVKRNSHWEPRPPDIDEVYFEPHVSVLTHDRRRDLFRLRNFDDYYPTMLRRAISIHRCYGVF